MRCRGRCRTRAAVTRGGEVFIPDTAGRLDTGAGRGLLAHELTHVIQQRRPRTSVPLEGTSPRGPAARSRGRDDRAATSVARCWCTAAATGGCATGRAGTGTGNPRRSPADEDDAKATARDIQDDADRLRTRVPHARRVHRLSPLRHASSRATQLVAGAAGGCDAACPRRVFAPIAAEEPSGSRDQPQLGIPTSDTPIPSRCRRCPPLRTARRRSPAGRPPSAVTQSLRRQPVAAAAPASIIIAGGRCRSAEQRRHRLRRRSLRRLIDLDDLARRVYGQVRTQLRSELLIDRRTRGTLTDFR